MNNIENIKDIFRDYKIGINGEEDMKRCSVLIPVVNIDGEDNIIFEIRNNKLNSNPGEICFPGGAIEEGETPKKATLRECFEEIGLGEENLEIISQLDFYVSPNNILIYPFLGVQKNQKEDIKNLISINKEEVSHILLVPLKYLLNYEPEITYSKIINMPKEDFPFHNIIGGKDYKFRDGRYKVMFYKYNNFVIWGMTARILENFLNVYKEHYNKNI